MRKQLMKSLKPLRMILFLALSFLAAATVGSLAEEAPNGKKPSPAETDPLIGAGHEVMFEAALPSPGEAGMLFKRDIISGGPGGGTFGFIASEMSFGGKPVKGAPYSAEAVTETTQTLSDGNRIQRKNNTSVYRDSEGRTRKEQTLSAIGPWAAAGDPPQMIFINDPVAGVNYILNPKDKTARKVPLPSFVSKAKAESKHSPAEAREAPRRIEIDHTVITPPMGAAAIDWVHLDRNATKPETESLGKRVIEGVEAEGTRTTIIIPADRIGNELPINIVSERWFSPELQVLVMSKHNDPRMGETVYRLAGISRSEQPRSLFEVPADYTIKEGESPLLRRGFPMPKKPEGNGN
jgi:hypothetical protein